MPALPVHRVARTGVAIMLTVLGANLLGDGLRDAFDPGSADDPFLEETAWLRARHRSASTLAASGPPSCARARSARARPAASAAWPSPTPTRRCATSSSPGARRSAARSTVDRVGNIFARRPGTDDHLPPVLMGSHLDTQVAGGKYDGIVGVLAGLEVLRTLDDRRVRTKRPLELVCWTNEEGARFTPPMVASGAFAGVFDVDWVLALRDDDGKVFGARARAHRLQRQGRGRRPRASTPTSSCTSSRARSSIARRCRSGSWWAATPTRGMHVDVRGETAHAGPTPMDRRRNALVGAAMLAVAVNDVGWKYHATEGKATVARLVAWPNKAGILSEYAQLTCDVRHADRAVADQMWAEVKAAMPECARRANVEMRIAGEWQFGSERFDPGCIRLIREAAAAARRRPPRHPEPGRPRRVLHLADRPHRDDLHAVPRRHLPQRGRARRARLHRPRRERPAARRARAGQPLMRQPTGDGAGGTRGRGRASMARLSP